MKDKDFDRTKIPKNIKDKLNKLTETTNKIKVASAIIAFITLGIYIFRKDKNIQNTMSVIDDILYMTKIITEKMLINSVNANRTAGTAQKTIQEILKDKKIQSMSKTTVDLITKVGVPLVVINGTYSSLKLLSNDDYDASFLSGLKTALTVSLLIASSVTSYVLLILLEIVWNYFSHYIIDSNIEKYLYKSLLYEDVYKHSGFFNIGSLYHINYKAYYLFETTNTNEKLKQINDKGFKTSKNLINFIGENYDENKEYFDTALRNELSFFKSSLLGYKLELLNETKRVKKLKNKYDIDIVLNQKTFIKISKSILDIEDFKLIFLYNNKYEYINKTSNLFIKDNDNIIFDLYNQDFAYLKELSQLNNKKASIIVLSPQIELKYDFIYDYKDLNYLFALNFKQSSFTIKDIEELEKLKEKRIKKVKMKNALKLLLIINIIFILVGCNDNSKKEVNNNIVLQIPKVNENEIGKYYKFSDYLDAKTDPIAATKIGYAYSEELKDYDKAIKWFKYSNSMKPTGTNSNYMCYAYQMKKDYKTAIKWCKNAIDLGNKEALFQLAYTYREKKIIKKQKNGL